VWAAFWKELLATIVLLPFWPLFVFVGRAYGAGQERLAAGDDRPRTPIVLLHGYGMNRTNWIWLGPALARRGFGPLYDAQGIFSDLFAALSILFDKPFRRGDTIRYDQSTGTVERIGLKTTRLRSITGEQLIMANTKLLEREIHNHAEASARRLTLYVAVGLDTPADALAKVPQLAGEAVAARKGCKLVRCGATGVGSGAIAYELVYDDLALENNKVAENRSAVLLGLVEGLRSQSIVIVRASDAAPPLAPF
jgi:hypothetical protein